MSIKKLSTRPFAIIAVFASLLALYLAQIIPAVWPAKHPQCDDFAASALPRVVMYGTSWCRFCRKTRWVFEDHNIAYCEFDIEASVVGAEQFKHYGGRAIPLIRIDQYQLHGFDKDTLNAALRRHGLM